MNKNILLGNLGEDPQRKTTSSGGAVVSLSIATSERWKDKTTGEYQEKTEWHKCRCFKESIANYIMTYAQTGATILIEEAKSRTFKWTDQSSGAARSMQYFDILRCKIIKGGKKKDEVSRQNPNGTATSPYASTPHVTNHQPHDDGCYDDDIPF